MTNWTVVSSRYVERSPWVNWRIDVCRLPDGTLVDGYHVSEFPPGVGIVAVTPELEVVLVRQYCHGIRKVLTEIPGGIIGPDDGTPLQAGQRELREETGYSSNDWTELARLYAHPSSQEYPVFLYLAMNAERSSKQELDENEQIEVVKIPLDLVLQTINGRGVQSMGSTTALLLAQEKMKTSD